MNNLSEWKRVRFGKIAQEKSKRIDNPGESGFERYVGLEHLDSGQLVVKRWGKTKDVTSTMKLFNKGDILFARRNTYLRRVSVAQFDGVCSGDIIVIEPILKEIVEGFLPVLMQFENFENRVISLSAGAFSKRIKWKQLAEEEVVLPPLKEQKKIAALLWSIEGAIGKVEKLVQINEKLKKGLLNELLTKGIGHNRFKKTEIGELPEEWNYGIFNELIDVNPVRNIKKDEEVEFISMADLLENNRQIQGKSQRKYKGGGSKFQNGDTLFARITPCLENGKIAFVDILKNKYACGSTEFIVLSGKEKISLNEYVYLIAISPFFRRRAINSMRGTTGRQRVPNDFFNLIKIGIPSLNEQTKIIKIVYSQDRLIERYYNNLSTLNNLKKKLTDDIFKGEIKIK